MTKCRFLLVLWFVSFSLLSKDLNLLPNFSNDNPLSYQFVRSIAQDQHGFMWFGTQEGLHRYDGYQFVSYHHRTEDLNSIGADVVSRVLVDKIGRLWVATRGGGLNLFNASQSNFYRFNQSSKTSIAHNNVNALFEDSEGKIWAGTEDGISILFGTSQSWQIQHIKFRLGQSNGLRHKVVHSIVQVNSNEIWVGTLGGGVSAFTLDGQFVKHIPLHFGDSELKLINVLYKDSENSVWIGTVDLGLHKINLATNDIVHYAFNAEDAKSVSSNTIEAIIQDKRGQIWIASDKGLMIYDHQNDNFWQYHHSPANPYSLKNDFILTLFEDSEELMWIGTLAGVNRWDPKQTTFSQFNAQKYPELTNSTVTDFTSRNEDAVLFSTYSGGIYQLGKHSNTISTIDLPEQLSDLRVMTILYEKQHLWIGTRSSGLYYLNLQTSEIKHFQHDAKNNRSISANSITDIIKTSSGDIWVSTFHNGINRLEADDGFERYNKNDQNVLSGPSSNHVMRIVEDNQGFLWLGTYGGGLNRFSPKDNSFIHLQHNENIATSISSDLAWLVFKDSKQNLWVGTQAAGLNMLSAQAIKDEHYEFVRFNAVDGMKSRTVYGIAEDKESGIWISTNKGISRYDTMERSFKHFGISHGLTELEYNHGAYFTDADNTLYFGSANGVTRVDPDKINKNHAAPTIKLISISRLNQTLSFDQPIEQIKQVNFDYSDQLISFEFVGLNYNDPTSTQYRYRLNGFDKAWIDAGSLRKANYTNLPSGSYQLFVKAKNSDNVWSEPTQLIEVYIAPAPWNTWWAYTLYAVFIVIAILSYIRTVNRKIAIEQQRQQELARQVEEKTQEFVEKNEQLELANAQLEELAIKDNLTNAKSRRYLDIYMEQASQLLTQIHNNLLPIHRTVLPRLYVVMVQLSSEKEIKAHHLLDCVELLKYTRNKDDVVVRLSDHSFALIGSENEQKAIELCERIANRSSEIAQDLTINLAFGFFPFDIENPTVLAWDEVNVIIEHALKLLSKRSKNYWLGVTGYKSDKFSLVKILQCQTLEALEQELKIVKPSSFTIV